MAVEQLLGVDCEEAAEEHRLREVATREDLESKTPSNGGHDITAYYEQLEATVVHV